jgi:YVTN family beta-propeller protein
MWLNPKRPIRMISKFTSILLLGGLAAILRGAEVPPSATLLVLNKSDNALAIVDPTTLKILAKVPAGQDPHEVVASADGKLAFVSNYGAGHTLSVIDLVAYRALPPVNLGALLSPHGLAQANGKIYFTAEGADAIGRYDPSTQLIDWVLGLGQKRTHMIVVSKDFKTIFTSNVNSDTISIIEAGPTQNGPGRGPPGPGNRAGAGGPGSGPPPPRGPNGPPGGRAGPGQGRPGGPPPGGMGGAAWTETHVSVGQGPEGFDLSPDGTEVWAANSHAGTISIIDVAKKSVSATLSIPTNSANRLKFTPDGKLVFISDLGSSDLVVVETTSRKELKRITLGGGPAGILMQPDGARAYVAVGADNGITIIDLKTLSIAGHIETGREPDGLGWAVRN